MGVVFLTNSTKTRQAFNIGRALYSWPQHKEEADLNNAPFDEVTHEFLDVIMEKFFAGWAMRSGEEVAKLCTEDVVWLDPAAPGVQNKPDDVARVVNSILRGFPDAHFAPAGVPAISRDGQTAFVPYSMTGTNNGPLETLGIAATGKAVAVQAVDTLRFRGGLIAEYRVYVDMLNVMRQLGLAPKG